MTAVEWLFEQLTEVDYKCINKTFLQNNNSLAGWKLRELFEQAKAMERHQIIRAVNHSIMELDEMRAEAIKQTITIGELYVKMNKHENNNSKNNPRT